MMSSDTSAPMDTIDTTTEISPQADAPKPTGFDKLRAKADALEVQEKSAPTEAEEKIEASVVPAQGIAPAPTYAPNFKFKAFGKEYEVEPWMQSIIKDADTEKKLKDVLSKAYALDDYKGKYENLYQTHDQTATKYGALNTDVQRVMGFRAKKDYRNFFAALQIPKNEIYEYVQHELSLDEAPPEQRAAYENQVKERERLYSLENENTQVMELYQKMADQARATDINLVMMKPEISSVASALEAKTGKQGAFRDLMVQEAQYVWYSQGKDISAEEAAQLVLGKYGSFLETSPAGDAQLITAAQANGQATQPIAPQAKPVIPKVPSSGSSPVKKRPKSLDDLRAEGRRLAAEANL